MTTPKKEIHGEFQRVYQKATMWLALKKGLFAQLMYALVNEVSSNDPMVRGTACTTGVKRFFDKEFMDKLPVEQQAAIMAHEIMHEMLLHPSRCERRDHQLWNLACDIKVNNLLAASGFTLPSGAVTNYQGETFAGKSEEFIYDFLEEEQEKGNKPVPDGYIGDLAGDEMTPEQIAQAKGRLQNAIEMHGHGSLPQELQDAINAVLNPREKWHEWLRKWFIAKSFSGCDWKQLDRRELLRTGMIAPPFQSDSLGTVVWSVDQSGSISQEVLDHVAAHVNSMMMDCRPDKVIVQYFDTQVHEVEEYTMQDLPITLRRVCGGGTCFKDACAKAEEYGASVHVILTDLEGSMPENSNVDTIWADFMGGHTAPFGEYIRVEIERGDI